MRAVGERLIVRGTVDAPNFAYYFLDFGLGPDPSGWGIIQPPTDTPVRDGVLGELDLAPWQDGPMTIRLILVDQDGNQAERRVTFQVENPEPTPTPTPEGDGGGDGGGDDGG